MNQLGHKPEMTGIRWDRILGEPDAVGEQSIAAGIHDAVQGGVVRMGKRVETVLGRWLQGTLYLDQGLGQLGRFG